MPRWASIWSARAMRSWRACRWWRSTRWTKAACGAPPSTPSSSGSNNCRAMAAPLHWCHLDGRLLPLTEARISPLDRSFLFGDGIYEVIPVYGGRLFRATAHLDRLARSAVSIQLHNPHDHQAWLSLLD